MISSIHVGLASMGRDGLATSMLRFGKNSRGILLSDMKSKVGKNSRDLANFKVFDLHRHILHLIQIGHHLVIHGEVHPLDLIDDKLRITEGV